MPSVPVNKGLRKALLFSVITSSRTQNPWGQRWGRFYLLLSLHFFP